MKINEVPMLEMRDEVSGLSSLDAIESARRQANALYLDLVFFIGVIVGVLLSVIVICFSL